MDRQIKKSANKFAEIANTNSMFNKNVLAKKALTLAASTSKTVKAPFMFSLFNLGKVNSILAPKRFCEFWMIFDKTGFQVENDIDEKESTEAKYF